MRRFLVKKTGDCGSPSTPKKPKADSERLVAAREYEDRRRRGFKAAWCDEFAWLTRGRRIHRSTTENFCWDEIRPRGWLNVDVGIFGHAPQAYFLSTTTTTGRVRAAS